MATPVAEIERSTKLAREYCLLNNYDTALVLYKHVLSELDAFSKKSATNRKLTAEIRKLISTVKDESDTVKLYVDEMNEFSNEQPPQAAPAGPPPLRSQNVVPAAVRNPKDPRDRRRDSAAGTAGTKPTSPSHPSSWKERREKGWDVPAADAVPPGAPAVWEVPPPAPAPANSNPIDTSAEGIDSGEDRKQRAQRVAEARRAAPRGPLSGARERGGGRGTASAGAGRVSARPPSGGGSGVGARRVSTGPRATAPTSPTAAEVRGGGAPGAAGVGGGRGRKPGVPRLSRAAAKEEPEANARRPRVMGGGKSLNRAGEVLDLGKENEEIVSAIERDMMVHPDEGSEYGVPFRDIAGLGEAKALLKEALIAPLLMPGFFTGIRKPWGGVLLYGPPGTGKTMLAKAVATEAGVTFFNVKVASIVSKWRGDSEKSIQLLYNLARHHAPSAIFIDEIDALCSARGGAQEHEASLRTKTEILTQMGGAMSKADAGKIVLTLGATNLPWNLDTAMLRRLEKHIHISVPDAAARLAMFKHNMRDCNVDSGVDYNHLVMQTEGYSGSDIANVCRDAAMIKLRRLLAGKDIDELRRMGDVSEVSEDLPVTMDDFITSLNNVRP